jgi:D-serine deaminase-like pyridoxal phosphate-dependent protein
MGARVPEGTARLDLGWVEALPVTQATVGFPAGASTTVGEVGAQGWNARDLVPPVVLLREDAIAHNLERMRRWVTASGVELWPHAKTTMAPQLWARQLAAGATGFTVATVAQAEVMRIVGVDRVMLASQVVDPAGIAWMARALDDPRVELMSWVDGADGVALLAAGLRTAGASRPHDVMIELGHEGGRTGCRTDAEALEVARAVAAAPELRLVGVGGYEGTLGNDRTPVVQRAVDAFLDCIGAVADRLLRDGGFGVEHPIVSAGGSIWFDRVPARLGGAGAPWRVVVRAGCTVVHDHGLYARGSPFAGAADAVDRFRPAMEARGTVLSRPERGVVVIGLGKRDVPTDVEPPIPLGVVGDRRPLGALTVTRVMDQHAICAIAPGDPLRAGEVVAFGISHPCTAFERRRIFPLLDHERVAGAVATCF